MRLLHKILGIKPLEDPELDERARATADQLVTERQQYRQTLQRLESGVRLMRTWDDAMHMMARDGK